MAEEHITPEDIPEQPAVTPADLGVDQASFDKYYKDGDFNWQGYSKELEYKISQRSEATPEAAEEAPQSTEVATEAAAQAAVENAGLDWDTLSQKISTTGDLDEEDYAALNDAGIPPDISRNQVRLMKTDIDNTINDVMAQFGGEDAFSDILTTLKSTVPEDIRNRIDTMLFDPLTRPEGVALAKRLAGQAEGTPTPAPAPAPAPVPSRGNMSQATPAVGGFQSMDEMSIAMNDPRYRTDPSYRAEVEKRAMNATFDFNGRTHTSGL